MKEGLMYFTDTYLTAFGLILFFGFFVGVIVWCARPVNKKRFRYFETLPFEHGENHGQ